MLLNVVSEQRNAEKLKNGSEKKLAYFETLKKLIFANFFKKWNIKNQGFLKLKSTQAVERLNWKPIEGKIVSKATDFSPFSREKYGSFCFFKGFLLAIDVSLSALNNQRAVRKSWKAVENSKNCLQWSKKCANFKHDAWSFFCTILKSGFKYWTFFENSKLQSFLKDQNTTPNSVNMPLSKKRLRMPKRRDEKFQDP